MLLVLAGALLLRLWQLGARSVWTDEGSTWTAASSRLGELVRLCAQKDASPPLFYMLTSLALRFGDDEAHLRAVSVLASLGLVWLTYRIARLAVPREEALLAAALCALSPFQLMYAQEARTYALVACFTVASLYLFARAVLFDRPRAWLPYVGMSMLALYTQGISLLGVGVQGTLVVATRAGRRGMLRWVLAQGAAFVLYAPWFFVSLAQAGRLHSSHWYLQTPGGHELFQVLRAVFLSPIPLVTPHPGAPFPGLDAWLPRALAHILLVALPTLPLLAALPSAIGRDHRATVMRFSLAVLLLPLLAVWIVSFRQPLWLPRYFVLLTPALCVLIARGLSSLRPRALSVAWTALVAVAGGYACYRYGTDYTKEPWRDAVRLVAATGPAGATAALVPFDVDPFRYYNRKQPSPVTAFEVSHPDVPFASGYTTGQLDQMERQARERSAPFEEVWVVVRSPNSDVRRELVTRTERVAAEGRTLIERRTLDSAGGPVRLARFRRAAAPDAAAPPSAAR
jgi:4-amino-4-deoxy-L-arabinose transferase-like glycosyltransferase